MDLVPSLADDRRPMTYFGSGAEFTSPVGTEVSPTFTAPFAKPPLPGLCDLNARVPTPDKAPMPMPPQTVRPSFPSGARKY
ncbi:hypothetical protein DIPPA_15859 [Diplonema papillatum]|nr:hypothetical protein DIPPA_15859 [Diplonema papillatum]